MSSRPLRPGPGLGLPTIADSNAVHEGRTAFCDLRGTGQVVCFDLKLLMVKLKDGVLVSKSVPTERIQVEPF
ncbi:hypothetical protein EVAR_50666_1 [Eumeta japonica]|uniref:Uncharacterized protein n=1 Tax=Eumeta variegata TaxID=151549 RepID=A0A4C1XPQ2_EUMVA|nr:hypothetical protein EVAR_50666_1 [Eumeta japonica]